MGHRSEIRHPVLTSLSVLAMLAATGCGSGGPAGQPTQTPTSSLTTTPAGPTEPATESAQPEPQPESDYRPPTGSGPTTRRPRPSVSVAGPTLDGHFPEVWGVLTGPGRYKCNVYTSGDRTVGLPAAEVPVTVESVRMVDHRPAGSPGLAVIEGGPCVGAHGTAETGYPIRTGCTGATLPPFIEEARGCSIGIRATGASGIDYTAVLRFSLSASCVSRLPRPCDVLPSDVRPSAEQPIRVTWTTERPIAACLSIVDRSGGYTEEEQEGRCPAAGATPGTEDSTPSDSTPTNSSSTDGAGPAQLSPTPATGPT